jgi:hypothetical protein
MNNKIIDNNPLLVEYNLNLSSKKQLASTEVAKKILKQEIQHAFIQGNLGFRVIDIKKEVQYFQKKDKDPRPVFLIAPEIPISMRAHSKEDASDEHIIGITKIKHLFSYKNNAGTYELSTQTDPDIRGDNRYKKALADTNSLLIKLYELSDRIWEVYPRSTSGHLTKDGTYSLPKLSKKKIANSLHHSELIMTRYEKQQIKCYCISETDDRKIVEIIAHKHKLETELKLENLPLVIYSEKSGLIKIFFEEDLNLKKLTENEDKIANLQAISGVLIKKKLAPIFPISYQINILGNSITNIEAPDIKNATKQLELRSKLINLIKNYDQYSIEDFQALINQGVNVKLEIYEKGFRLFLVDKLLAKMGDMRDNIKFFTQGLDLLTELFKLGAPGSIMYLTHYFFHENNKIETNYRQLLKIYVAASTASDNVSLHGLDILFILTEKFTTDNAIIVTVDKILQDRATSINQIFISLIHKIINLHIELIFLKPREITNCLITSFQLQFIVMFSYGVNPYLIQETIIKTINHFKTCLSAYLFKLYGENPEQHILQYILTLYDDYKTNPVYIDWISKLTFAKQDIETLKKNLGIVNNNTHAVDSNQNKNSLARFFTTLLDTTLVFNRVANDNQTISAILQHYYRRPGPLQAIKNINNIDWPLATWKSIHSSSHVLRAYNNATWYMQLLEKFNLINLTDEEKLLLQLAVVYHDAAAEDVSKKQEEQKSAYYFTRDLTGKFSAEILEKIALALEAKENDIHGIEPQHNDADIDKYTRIIRFADRMDFVRCSTIVANFPNFTYTTTDKDFNAKLLNIPEVNLEQFTSIDADKTLFQRHLEAAMHGAVDLAIVAGGDNNRDLRSKGDYKERYKLKIDNQRLKIAFEQTDKPVSQLGILLDNNVRRKIAQLADIHTCNDPNHKVCKADIHEGVMYGIHSTSNDLSQVNIPETMTLLEKMQIEHDYSLLSEATQNAITLEINRLQTEGIKMSLGTLTQKTLKSDAARATLKTRGITVISEMRARGFNSLQEQKYHEMLVPQKISNSSD